MAFTYQCPVIGAAGHGLAVELLLVEDVVLDGGLDADGLHGLHGDSSSNTCRETDVSSYTSDNIGCLW